jgi:hypothetical protein
MRTLITALGTGAAFMGAGLLANAASPDERHPEARAYVQFKFGGASHRTESFFYGLRLDHDSRFHDQPAAPLLAVEFNNAGFSSASIQGMPFVDSHSLNQAEAGTLSAVNWGVLAAGVVGVGAVAVAVADSEDESPDPGSSTGGAGAGGDTGGGTGGTGGGTGGTGGGTGGTGGGTGGTGGGTGGTGGGLLGLVGGFTEVNFRVEYANEKDALAAAERQRVLDGGTGFMGDLIARD